jgi:hypothetical protein
MKFCPQCGTELNEGAKFCTTCGFQLKVQEQAPTPTPPPPPAPEPPKPDQRNESNYEQATQATQAFSDAISGKTNLFQRVINILTKPKDEWQVINNETPNVINLIVGYALVLSLIPAIALFIRYGLIGTTVWGVTYRNFGTAIMQALIQVISAGVGVYLFAWVIDLLASSFESEKNMGKSLQLAAYSYTPVWILGILNLIGLLGSLAVFLGAVYTIYLLYLGIPVLKRTPKDKVTGYLVISIIAMLVIYFVVAMILGAILGLIFVTGGGFRGL